MRPRIDRSHIVVCAHMRDICCTDSYMVAVCCSVLQCVAVCCSVSQCVAVCCSVLLYVHICEIFAVQILVWLMAFDPVVKLFR